MFPPEKSLVNIFDNFLIFQVLQHLQAVLILQVDLWRLLPYPQVRAEGTTRWQKRDNEDVQRDNETNFSERYSNTQFYTIFFR
jgi:hypothetical protein